MIIIIKALLVLEMMMNENEISNWVSSQWLLLMAPNRPAAKSAVRLL